jgi:hypothetical protein
MYTAEFQRTSVNHTQYLNTLAMTTLQSHGELVELLLVFLEYLVVVLTELDKQLLETCVVVVECLHLPKPGEDGTERSLLDKEDAICSALAASAVTSLVLARGHRVEQLAEVPLVVDNKAIEAIDKTKRAVAFLKSIGAYADVEKVIASHRIRTGKGKMRNRRYVQRRGPLVIYNENAPFARAFRNVPGVELVSVTRLNLLQLAPGGHVGRFIIWTRDAFERLNSIYGTYKASSSEKADFSLPFPIVSNADIGRIANSHEVQSVLRPKVKRSRFFVLKKNPLKNLGFMVKLNPYAKVARRTAILTEQARLKRKQAIVDAKRKGTPVDANIKKQLDSAKATRKSVRKANKAFVSSLLK